MKNYLVMTVVGCVLAGCATNAAQNDPSQGGFGNAISGVLGGQYDERIKQREVQAEATSRRNANLAARSGALKAERSQLSLEVGRARKRIVSQNTRIENLGRKMQKSTTATEKDKKQLAALSSRASALRGRADKMDAYSSNLSASGVRDELAELERESGLLSTEFDLLASGIR